MGEQSFRNMRGVEGGKREDEVCTVLYSTVTEHRRYCTIQVSYVYFMVIHISMYVNNIRGIQSNVC